MSGDARSLAVLGESLRQNGNYSGAIEQFDKAIQANSKYWWAYAHRAAARAGLGDYQGALQDFEREGVEAYYEKHNRRWFLAQKGELYRLWTMATVTSTREENDARSFCHRRNEMAHYEHSWELLSERAIELFREALAESEVKNPWILAHRGATYTMRYWIVADNSRLLLKGKCDQCDSSIMRRVGRFSNEYERALEDFNEALKLNPNYGWVYLFLAILQATRPYYAQILPGMLTPGTVQDDMDESMVNIGKAQMSGLNRDLSMSRAMMEMAIYMGGELAQSCSRESKEAALRVFQDGVQIAWRVLQVENDETFARYFVANGLNQIARLRGVEDPTARAALSRARAALNGMNARVLAMRGGLDCLEGKLRKAEKKLKKIRELGDIQALTIVSRDPAWARMRQCNDTVMQSLKSSTADTTNGEASHLNGGAHQP